MIINTFTFSKGLIISIVYIVIILTFVKCNGSDTEDNKKQPVPDYEPGGVKDKNYFEYHFRSTYPGQFKLNPKNYFASKYILPELKYAIMNLVDGFDNFNIYQGSLRTIKYAKRLRELKNNYNLIKDQESDLARAIEKTYEVTKNAYIAVGNFENNVDGSKEELKNIKNVAIQDYLENQMSISTLRSTISVKYDEIDFFYVIKNYELYIDPTEEIFYRSKVIAEEISALEKAIASIEDNSCQILNYEEFDEVIFLYVLLPNEDDNCEKYEKMKILFKESFVTPTLKYKYGISKAENDPNSYRHLCNKMKSKFVVNNENFMSYLVRLKAQGYIGIHQDIHKFLYGVRKEDYSPKKVNDKSSISYTIDMDLLEEDLI